MIANKKYKEGELIGMWVAIGITLGFPLGFMLGSIALGPAISLPVGLAIGVILEKNNDQNSTRLTEEGKTDSESLSVSA